MSQANKQTTTDPAKGSIASRTRKQTRIHARDDEREEKQQPAQSSAHVSPAMRIYRHALEAIFAMLQLHDLSRALAVSRSWSAAVKSMKPSYARIAGEFDFRLPEKSRRNLPAIATLIASPLLKHVAAIEIVDRYYKTIALTSESLALLVQHAPNLTSLWCELTLTEGAPLILPPNLTSLRLSLSGDPFAAELNVVLTTLTLLPHLSRLDMVSISDFIAEVDLSILAAAPALLEFGVNFDDRLLTEGQAHQIRSKLSHLERISITNITPGNRYLERLLRPPIAVRWRDIGTVSIDAQTGDLLESLPSLTTLNATLVEDVPHLNFLSKLPLLSSLQLDCRTHQQAPNPVLYISADAALAPLLSCTALTELGVECCFNSAQFTTLFAKLTKLRQLTFRGTLESLQCFASGPITQTLQELELRKLETLPPSELSHLYALNRLRRLKLCRCFPRRLDAATIDSISPPSSRLPSLTEVDLSWLHKDDQKWDVVKRSGPSFEWMQQRLTQ